MNYHHNIDHSKVAKKAPAKTESTASALNDSNLPTPTALSNASEQKLYSLDEEDAKKPKTFDLQAALQVPDYLCGNNCIKGCLNIIS